MSQMFWGLIIILVHENYVLYWIYMNICNDYIENVLINDLMFTNERVCYKISPMTACN